jgi:hypothetical protein
MAELKLPRDLKILEKANGTMTVRELRQLLFEINDQEANIKAILKANEERK